MNFYTIALPRGWWILLDFEKNVLALQRIYLVNSYTFEWHKSFCQTRKTSRILEIKKFPFNAIFDWFRKKLRQLLFHPGDHVSVCFGFLVWCCSVILCVISVVVVFLRLLTADEFCFWSCNFTHRCNCRYIQKQ